MHELILVVCKRAIWGKWQLFFDMEEKTFVAYRGETFMGEVKQHNGTILLMSPKEGYGGCTAWEYLPEKFAAALPEAISEFRHEHGDSW